MSREYLLESEFLKKSTGFKSIGPNTLEDGFLRVVEKREDAKPLTYLEEAKINMDCTNINLVADVKEVLLYQLKVSDISFVRNFGLLERLDLIRLDNLDLTDLASARNMRRVKELFISDCTFAKGKRGMEMGGLLRSINKNDLSFNSFYSLRSITLENIHNIDPNTILKYIHNPEIVETLKLNNEVVPTKRTMSGYRNLKELVIGNNMARSVTSQNNLSAFLEAIPNPDALETLYIREANLNGSDLEVLKRFRNLKNLYIDNIKEANIAKILENVPRKGRLENLIVSQCDFRNVDMSVLSQFSGLQNLYITNNENVNGNSICRALQGKRDLQMLNICNNKISDYESFSKIHANQLYAIGNKLPLKRMIREYKRDDIRSDDRIIGFDGIGGRDNFLRVKKNERGELEKSIHIHSKDLQEIAKYIKFSEMSTLTLQLEKIEDIRPYVAKLGNVQRVNIEIPNTKALSLSEASFLQEHFNIDKVIVADEKDSNSSYERNSYDIDDYISVKRRINNIISRVPKRLGEAERFLRLYEILQEEIVYDKQILSTYEDYSKVNTNESRNMINGLLLGKCVCAGFSDILKNCLSEIGIEAREISGNNHQWNQVKIEGRWYNVDLTADASRNKNYGRLSFDKCLLSDKEYTYSKYATVGDAARCTQSFDKEAIEFYKRKGRLPIRKKSAELMQKVSNNINTRANQFRDFLKRRRVKKLPKEVTIQATKQELKRFEDMPEIESVDEFLGQIEEKEKNQTGKIDFSAYKTRTERYKNKYPNEDEKGER